VTFLALYLHFNCSHFHFIFNSLQQFDILRSFEIIIEHILTQWSEVVFQFFILGKAIDKLEIRFGKNIVKVGFTNKDIPNKQGFMMAPKLIY